MPIADDEFRKKRSNDSDKARIEIILMENKAFAFSSTEITLKLMDVDISSEMSPMDFGLALITTSLKRNAVEKLLEELIHDNKVEKSKIEGKGEMYYIWK